MTDERNSTAERGSLVSDGDSKRGSNNMRTVLRRHLSVIRLGKSPRGRGQSMVEFAMVIPFFFVIFAAIISFGLALYSNMSLINAAREGARTGAMTATTANIPNAIQTRVNSAASDGGLGLSGLTTTITCVTLVTTGVDPTTATPCLWSQHFPPTSKTPNTGGAQQGDAVKVVLTYQVPNPFPLNIKLGNTVVGLPSSFTLSSSVQMTLDSATNGS
jgi:Flp pilus assembly protein TadG